MQPSSSFLQGGEKSRFIGFLQSGLRVSHLHCSVSAKPDNKKNIILQARQRQLIRSTFFFFPVYVLFLFKTGTTVLSFK